MPKGNLTYIDRGWESFEAAVAGGHGKTLSIGIWDNEVAEYALRLEFGPNSRGKKWPFLDPTIRKNRKAWADQIIKRLHNATVRRRRAGRRWPISRFDRRISKSGTMSRILRNIGKIAVKDVQKEIMRIQWPKLEDSTAKKKGHTKPLIDSTLMYNSIEYEVE